MFYLIFSAREGGLRLQSLTGEYRSAIVNRLADLLIERKADIIAANQQDVSEAYSKGNVSIIHLNFFDYVHVAA